MKRKIIISIFIFFIAIFTTVVAFNKIYADEALEEIKFEDEKLYVAVKEELNNQGRKYEDSHEKNTIKMASNEIGKVTTLSLKNKGISDMSGIGSFTSLYNLDLSHNNITEIKVLESLENLRILSLNNNNITDISELGKLTSLMSLSLGNNNITEIKVLESLKNLISLSLDNNNIKDLSELGKLTSLYTLVLNNNNITDLSVLTSLQSLQLLYLDSTNITDISKLRSLTNLTYLSLNNNNITDLSVLISLPKLKELYLDSTNITDLSELENLENLETLSLNNNNNMTDLSVLTSLPKLKKLYLDSTNITDISKLESLTNLEILSLNNDNMTDLSVLKSLPKLKNLYLDSTNITDLSKLESLENLETLSLNNDNMTDLSVLKSFQNLNELYLKSNGITDISDLANLTKLTKLDLSNNKITDISKLENLVNLTDLDLSSNKIDDATVIDTNLKNLTNLSIENQKLYLSASKKLELPKIFLQSQDESSKLHTNSVFNLENCTLSDDKKSVVIGEDKNTATVKITDGNAKDTLLTINIVDPLELSLSKTPNEITKENVEVTITSNKEINEENVPDGWTLSEDKKKLTKEYDKNAEETVTVTDTNGEKEEVLVKVDNIDKEAPQVEYTKKENDNGSVDIFLTVIDENVDKDQVIQGWEKVEEQSQDNKIVYKKTYTDRIDEEIIIKDLAGNEKKISIKEEKENTDNSNNPFTGDTLIYLSIALLLGISVMAISTRYLKKINNK